MKVAEIISQALEKNGMRNLRTAAKTLGISQELLRITVNRGHIPKDKMLITIAEKLGLDKTALILAAHQEKVPVEVKGYFLSPGERKSWKKKRVWPLSEEQCTYLRKVMNEKEIQIVRKLRQVQDEGKVQVMGYVDYMWALKKASTGAGGEKR